MQGMTSPRSGLGSPILVRIRSTWLCSGSYSLTLRVVAVDPNFPRRCMERPCSCWLVLGHHGQILVSGPQWQSRIPTPHPPPRAPGPTGPFGPLGGPRGPSGPLGGQGAFWGPWGAKGPFGPLGGPRGHLASLGASKPRPKTSEPKPQTSKPSFETLEPRPKTWKPRPKTWKPNRRFPKWVPK